MRFARTFGTGPVVNRIVNRIARGVVALLLLSESGLAANNLGTIKGSVRDASGRPVSTALVTVATPTPLSADRKAFTDTHGAFSIENLRAGEYSVQVSMPRFVASQREKIQLAVGAIASLTVTLQTAGDMIRRAASPDAKQSQDIVWTLRSSRSTQPVLRFADSASAPVLKNLWSTYSGYFQFYSKSDMNSRRASDTVGSRFSVTLDLPANAKVTFAGQYNESPLQPKGASALYEFSPAEHHRSQIGINVRQGVLLDDVFSVEELKEFQMKYSDKFQVTDTLAFEHGAEIGHAEGRASNNYLRPKASLSWVPNDRTVFTGAASTQAPGQTDDPIRGRDYFEQVSLPPSHEHYLHTEFSASRFLSDEMKVSVAIFNDRSNHRALFVSAPDGRRGLLVFGTKEMPSQGLRIHVNREFHGFEAGLGYTAATGPGLSPTRSDLADPSSLNQVRNQIAPRQFHVVTARMKTDFNLTNTELTAVYRWISKYAAGPIDPYQQIVEYNDPTLSISVAQNLPTFGAIPAKVQAIVDARNLLEQSFGSQKTQLAHSPRYLKGGISIRF